VVEVHSPRERVGLRPLLEEHHRSPELRELDAEDETGRAGADDGDVHLDVDGNRHAHAWRSGWWPQALIAS